MARIKVSDIEIGYNARGAGAALVFLHGVGSDKSVWDRQLASFSAGYRAIALDYPGYGDSGMPPGDLDRAAIAGYVLGALDALGIGAAHLVGLSMGGVIALELARSRPERLRSLVLADSFAWHPDGDAIVARTRAALERMSMREFAEQRVEVLLAPGAGAMLRHEVVETMSRIDRRAFGWASLAVWTPDYRADLPRIATPTLVLVGEHDQITPAALSEALAAGIPGAHLALIRGAGHISNIDQPAAFDALVEAFISKV